MRRRPLTTIDPNAANPFPCSFTCGKSYVTEQAQKYHERVAHGVRGARTADMLKFGDGERERFEEIRRRVCRGRGDGYMDTSALIDLIVMSRRRSA